MGELVGVQPVKDLLGRGPPGFFQHGGGCGSGEDHDQSFEGCGDPRDAHLVGEVEEPVGPRVAVA